MPCLPPTSLSLSLTPPSSVLEFLCSCVAIGRCSASSRGWLQSFPYKPKNAVFNIFPHVCLASASLAIHTYIAPFIVRPKEAFHRVHQCARFPNSEMLRSTRYAQRKTRSRISKVSFPSQCWSPLLFWRLHAHAQPMQSKRQLDATKRFFFSFLSILGVHQVLCR
jgi:hypothetical protein